MLFRGRNLSPSLWNPLCLYRGQKSCVITWRSKPCTQVDPSHQPILREVLKGKNLLWKHMKEVLGWGGSHQKEHTFVLVAKDFSGKLLAFYLSEPKALLGNNLGSASGCQVTLRDEPPRWVGFGWLQQTRIFFSTRSRHQKDITVRGQKDDILSKSGDSNPQLDGGKLLNTILMVTGLIFQPRAWTLEPTQQSLHPSFAICYVTLVCHLPSQCLGFPICNMATIITLTSQKSLNHQY